MYVYVPHVLVLEEVGRLWESNADPWQQQVLLTTEPILQPLKDLLNPMTQDLTI